VATRYQDGSDLQAGTPISSVKAEPLREVRRLGDRAGAFRGREMSS
jgi:hypothetical protein